MTTLGTVMRTPGGGTILLYERVIDKAPAQVWAMLTEPELLQRWLDRAEVDLRLGGAFVLHFPDGPMRGVIQALEPERLLEYSWGENDAAPPSVVRWMLSPQEGRTKLKLMHILPPGTPEGDPVELGGGWHVILDRLVQGGGVADQAALRESEARYAGLFREAPTLARDGELSALPGGGHAVRFTRSIARPVAKVWAGLTDPKILANWLGDVEIEPRVGGKFVLTFRDLGVVMTGRITAFEPERVLEFTWLENYGMPQSLARWELTPQPGGCRLVLLHSFPKDAKRSDILPFLGGWEAFLDVIAQGIDGLFVPYRSDEPYAALYRAKYAETA